MKCHFISLGSLGIGKQFPHQTHKQTEVRYSKIPEHTCLALSTSCGLSIMFASGGNVQDVSLWTGITWTGITGGIEYAKHLLDVILAKVLLIVGAVLARGDDIRRRLELRDEDERG